MAVAQGYGKTVTSGSVFAYDTGDTRNSYIGEPTVNQYTNPDFSNGTTGWAFASWDGNVTYTTEAVTGPFGKTINALKLTKNATSAYSHFHQYNSGKYTTGNQYTLSAWVKGTGTFRGNTQWGGIVQSFTLTGDWQYVQYTVTAPNNDNFPYWAAEALTTGTVFYMVYAQSEQKSHATPFVNGTRSATQGLLPLVGNTSLDLSNVSFDSNAQMTFDGTNDYFDIPYSSTLDTPNGCTYELMVYPTGAGEIINRGTNDGNDNPRIYLYANGTVYFDWSSGGTDRNITSIQGLTVNAWNHLVCTATPGSSLKIYKNSIEIASGTTQPNPLPNTSDNIQVGRVSWIPRYGSAKIDVLKIYNRTLSAGEIRQNYLHYKTRFNLS